MIKPLSKTEAKALRMFSYGVPYDKVGDRLGLAFGYIHTLAYNIRRKTGIHDTKDAEECKAWFHGVRQYTRSKINGPTKTQLGVMALVAQGKSYVQVAEEMELSLQSAQNYASLGCRRAGIVGRGHYRTNAIIEYLRTLTDYPHTPEDDGKDPMDEF